MAPVLSKDDRDIKKKILNAARSIRKKYLALKLERNEEDEAISRILNPITDPLKELVKNTVNKKVKPKEVKLEAPTPQRYFKFEHSFPKHVEFQPENVVAETGDDNDDVFDKPLHEVRDSLQKSILERSEAYEQFLDQYPEIAREYVDKYYNESDEIDHSYGLRHEMDTDIWTMGSQKVNFLPNGDIKVGDISYRGSRGLYDILFLKNPIYHTEADKLQFKDILSRTNAHRRDFDPSKQVRGSTSSKYRHIVKPMLSVSSEVKKIKSSKTSSTSGRNPSTRSTTKSGSALLEYNSKPKQYVYYDDVNELIERLAKLDASQEAGNTNNINEIMSILEELVELGVIRFNK